MWVGGGFNITLFHFEAQRFECVCTCVSVGKMKKKKKKSR